MSRKPKIRAPRRRGARIVFSALVVTGLAIPVVRQAAASGSGPAPATRAVSTAPDVVFESGAADRRQTVIAAIERFVSVGLQLPDLRVRIHSNGIAGCDGLQGEFRTDGQVGVIDLCFGGEFLALHELGHAWERFNLDDRDRAEFLELTDLTTWRSTDVTWHARGAESAANVLAFGLLSAPLANAGRHTRELEEFKALTGIESPRLHEPPAPTTTAVPLSAEQRARLAAYYEWRRTPEPR